MSTCISIIKPFSRVLLCGLLILAGSAWAGANDAVVTQVWVGESIPGQKSATLELNITTVRAATLLSVSCDAAEKVEIRSVTKRGRKMSARVLDNLPLAAHRTTTFGSHRLFLILVGLKKELNTGDRIPVHLVVGYGKRRKQTINVEAVVKKMELSYKHLGAEEIYDFR